MIFENKVLQNKSLFLKKVEDICIKLGIDPDWLMIVMYIESGLNPQAVNKQPGDSSDPYERTHKRGTGLIQFMPDTSIGLGTTNQKLYYMNNVEQLDYVLKYYIGKAGNYKSGLDLYLWTFFPIALKHSENNEYVFQSNKLSASSIAIQNPLLDHNKDGVITMGEYKDKLIMILKSFNINQEGINSFMYGMSEKATRYRMAVKKKIN